MAGPATSPSIDFSILHLADEVLEMVFACPQLDHRDLSALAAVCSRFCELSCSRELWKKKCLKRWKCWSFDTLDSGVDWKVAYRERLVWERLVYPAVRVLAALNFSRETVSHDTMFQFDKMLQGNDSVPVGLMDALTELSNCRDSVNDLTMKYYASRVRDYATMFQLERDARALCNLPSDDIQLDKGAILLSQWQNLSTRVSADYVYQKLDAMANRVRELLAESLSSQSVSYVEKENCHSGKQSHGNTSVDESHGASAVGESCLVFGARSVLHMLNKVMFKEWKFAGNTSDYYNPVNSYVDEVIRTRKGIPITLCIIYAAVARRLGVNVEPVNFPRHFLVRFCEAPPAAKEKVVPVYVDVFNGGQFMTAEQCIETFPVAGLHFMSESLFAVPHPRDVYSRMVRNLLHYHQTVSTMDTSAAIQHLLRYLHIIEPDNVQNTKLLCTVNVHLGINGRQTIEMLDTIPFEDDEVVALREHAEVFLQKSCEHPEVVIKRRTNPQHLSVTYRVGLVMRHKRFNYICVIYGWDPVCRMSAAWQLQMGVHHLPDKASQPFYNVLVEDKTIRYAAQENLEMAPAEAVKPDIHPRVGKYFSAFKSLRYIPNVELAKRYPDDV